MAIPRSASPTLLGVSGWPVRHSRSPAMHNAALAELGRSDWLYVQVPLSPERFAATVPALAASGFRGLNVTVPHKQAALKISDDATRTARAIGAANTLSFADGAIQAENTDASGFLDVLPEPPIGRSALVLGAGGSARAVVWALAYAGAREVGVWNRTPERARELAQRFDAVAVDRPEPADLIVNCTSVGLQSGLEVDAAVETVGLTDIEVPPTFVDLVYGATEPPLSAWARRGGAEVIDGRAVLVAQGARSLELWTAAQVSRQTMTAALTA